MMRRRADCASGVIVSASSRIMSLKRGQGYPLDGKGLKQLNGFVRL